MMPPRSFVVLLTAAIDPAGMSHLVLHDPAVRRQQYVRALDFLLRLRVPQVAGVVFVENTGADLADLRAVAAAHPSADVEFISLDLNDYPRELGKGYGEFRMIDEAVARSRLLAAADYMVKITGRLGVGNLSAILAALPPDFDLAADLPFPDWVDSRLLIIRTDVYRRAAVGLYRRMDDSRRRHAENLLLTMLDEHPEIRVVPLLPREPRWMGAAGTTGTAYDSLGQRLKYPYKALRRAIRRLRGAGRLRRAPS
jgi:hypothetical protein